VEEVSKMKATTKTKTSVINDEYRAICLSLKGINLLGTNNNRVPINGVKTISKSQGKFI
jgi:hypothetical protein